LTADQSRSIESLLQFLKQAGMEGLINPAVARARRNAIARLSGELTPEESSDVSRINVDDLASRFHKLEGSSIRMEALDLYAERFRMALADFLAWLDNPAGFVSVGGERKRAVTRGSLTREQQVAERITLEASDNPSDIIPIALRPDISVYLANLPLDLTRGEAEKIARVVRAFADDGSADDSRESGQ
jgi:hypothetical protein